MVENSTGGFRLLHDTRFWRLLVANGLGNSPAVIVVSTAGLVAIELAPSQSMLTLPGGVFLVVISISAIFAARFMARFGRAAGYVLAGAIGVVSCVVGALAVGNSSFWLFLLSTSGMGVSGGFIVGLRFAVMEVVPKALKAKALSYFMAGGVLSGVIGGTLIHLTRSMTDFPFQGTYFSLAAVYVVLVILVGTIDFSSAGEPEPAQVRNEAEAAKPAVSSEFGYLTLLRRPDYVVAMLVGAGTFALMSLVMTSSPLAMVHEFSLGVVHSTSAIQLHVFAMFLPSIFTGYLIIRFGDSTMAAVGLVTIAICSVIALVDQSLFGFYPALILLGVGWNFGWLGGTSMVSKTYSQAERGKAEGLNDFVVFAVVAIASLGSGLVWDTFGWKGTVSLSFPICIGLLGMIFWRRYDVRAEQVAALEKS